MTGAGRGIRLDDEQRLAWLRLIRSENIGPVTFRELINHFGSGLAAIAAVPELAERGGRRIRLCSVEDAERERDGLARIGAQLVAMGEPDYPPALRHVADAPPLIAARGDTAILSRPIVAMVGSRNASVAGRKFAAQIAAGLGRADYATASGLARGIDAAVHLASLDTGTIAVLAGGLDQVYPPENRELADQIVASGGVHLSEMPFGWVPRGRDFPRRNRIISGVALAVVVVEAATRSGSLITARRAADQGRMVMAVPGSPLDPRAAGSNRLIKDGATMVTELDDILSELSPMLDRYPSGIPEIDEDTPEEPPAPTDVEDRERAAILAALGPTPVEVDEIIRFTGARPAAVHLVLLELALAGRLERHPGQRVSLV
ncbi:MAG: DNA-processing protein DprA [Bauldia sp.]|uniref:DNA-processing protein DprA n=1 Tax=Bauldia sp. TaxID=2575872 RepID=UPI001D91B0E8|nr:DNA-processing protein DprA [Bauldia sp.]MCB1489142.1 DNA-processing protein DprA [Bauldia sp.]MCB1498066.1 DNA-processing protein DprA [Bauldia sp.]